MGSQTVKMIKGMHLERAKQFLNNVIAKKEIVAFRRFNYGAGRKAQVIVVTTSQSKYNHSS